MHTPFPVIKQLVVELGLALWLLASWPEVFVGSVSMEFERGNLGGHLWAGQGQNRQMGWTQSGGGREGSRVWTKARGGSRNSSAMGEQVSRPQA